jgi:hypothetical protein
MDTRMAFPAAEILGLQALSWLAADEEAPGRFLAASGADADALRQATRDPAQLGVILEFLLMNEGLLIRFCGDTSTKAQALHAARRHLEGT